METVELEPLVLANRSGVAFTLRHRNGTANCIITIKALEMYFWLEPRASDDRVFQTFEDGYARIKAIAERKLRVRPSARLQLTPDDFEPPQCTCR